MNMRGSKVDSKGSIEPPFQGIACTKILFNQVQTAEKVGFRHLLPLLLSSSLS